ncbi:hypothetical protein BofuT4_uP122380.1 [Botrytis cinerea T4]|uniref:Uncharacterized protein n=1 Tax=Botryotinia fuckeliana (strain T4) TaxID=999810 RepID=G2YNM1_BOTF4|nr:hypothetical protein BofuT4_uP122380.1 [Botrytis cinerea T4]
MSTGGTAQQKALCNPLWRGVEALEWEFFELQFQILLSCLILCLIYCSFAHGTPGSKLGRFILSCMM